MARISDLARIAVALLAVLITAAGAPIALCAAMPDCPAMTPATSCHGPNPGERHCAPARFEASDDCCTPSVDQSLPAAAMEKLSAAAATELPVAAGAAPSLPTPARTSMAALAARPLAPSGRTLLSLHHTLLI